ncbi:hypothetical protein N5U14_02970 [Aliarcobacter butzleri]|uniref:hypothetical protein n=1 Tax=Aliarcobacter butzleri TaxID=28197 RepID=UPI0021B25B32|nr:hypothetical protein [Aliarcobacter butzleri]MCT7609802.1 hypothetical protein [Aliarcobacter butzleri]
MNKIGNMLQQDRNLNYSEEEKQPINLYYEKLNKSKSTDNILKKPKDEILNFYLNLTSIVQNFKFILLKSFKFQ